MVDPQKNSNNVDISALFEEIKQLQDKLEAMEKSVSEKLDKISKETEKMEQHVEFVEGIYEKIKSPFHFAMNKISVLSGKNSEKLEN